MKRLSLILAAMLCVSTVWSTVRINSKDNTVERRTVVPAIAIPQYCNDNGMKVRDMTVVKITEKYNISEFINRVWEHCPKDVWPSCIDYTDAQAIFDLRLECDKKGKKMCDELIAWIYAHSELEVKADGFLYGVKSY